ncbi:MAG TPA: M55 family metallopeptidase [Thermomicrobiales bacterium]
MRILISADAEGVTGATTTTELMFGRPHWEWMRGMMTDDVNAAVEGGTQGVPGRRGDGGRRQRFALDDDQRTRLRS